MLSFDFASTILFHLRYELLFSALFGVILLLSPGMRAQVVGKGKKKAPKLPTVAKDPASLAARITEMCSSRYNKAMDLFNASGSQLVELPWAEHLKVLVALAVASVRVGRLDRLAEVFQCLAGREPAECGAVLVHVMRVVTSRQQYTDGLETLAVWRREVSPDEEAVPSLAASCLLQCAVLLRRLQEAQEFFELLGRRGDAGAREYSCMIRLLAALHMADEAYQMLEQMQKNGLAPDNIAYNMVLSVCSNAQQETQVKALLSQMKEVDIVTYNTRLQACVRTKDIAQAFAIRDELKEAGIAPNEVTYGTLLEVCTRASDLERARGVLKMMSDDKVPKNTIVYTTMIRGLAVGGRIQEAMEVFQELRDDPSVKPDVICFSVLIKACCDQGDLEQALTLLEQLLEAGHAPDEILFNSLLAGCVPKPHVQLGEKLLADMVVHRIKPTMATFSIMLKMYSKAGAFQQSQVLLEDMPKKYGVVPAQRLYVQHISWCIRLRRGASAVQVFTLLLERCPETAGLDSFLTACASFNMLETGCSFVEIDPARFSTASLRDLSEVLERKNKAQLVSRVETALRKQAERK